MSKASLSRRRKILAELEARPSLRVAELAERLSVSAETIRRDLDALKVEGLVDRTYGGAVRRRSFEPSFAERHHMRVAERERIARRVTPLLRGVGHIMIGSGATTAGVARRIAWEMNDITVIAHSFGVAGSLAGNPTVRVLMAPGTFHPGESAVHGVTTVEYLANFYADVAILGASGIDEQGVSDALVDAGDVYRAMAANAGHTFVVADSSKYGTAFPARWASWSAISALITEAAPPEPIAAAAAAAGTTVVLA